LYEVPSIPLRCIGNTTHSIRNTEEIVVDSPDVNLSRVLRSYVLKVKLKSSVINTGEISSSRGLVFFGVERKAVDEDTLAVGNPGVMVVRLDKIEVFTTATSETFNVVKLNETINKRVVTNSNTGVDRVNNFPVGPVIDVSLNGSIFLNNPDKFLNGMIEVHPHVGSGNRNNFVNFLELSDKILMGALGEVLPFLVVKVDVVNPNGGVSKTRSLTNELNAATSSPVELNKRPEFKLETNVVELKGNDGESKTGVLAEPEEERYLKNSLGLNSKRSLETILKDNNISRVSLVVFKILLTNHLVVTSLFLGGEGKLIPYIIEHTKMLINSRTTNLNRNFLN
jgi:hypothetical protein